MTSNQKEQDEEQQQQHASGGNHQEAPPPQEIQRNLATPARPHHQIVGPNAQAHHQLHQQVGPPRPPPQFRSSPVHFHQQRPPAVGHHPAYQGHSHGGSFRMGPPSHGYRYQAPGYHNGGLSRGPPQFPNMPIPPRGAGDFQQQRQHPQGSNNNPTLPVSLKPRHSPVHPMEVLPSPLDSMKSGGCTCKKSRCLKLYCQCFSSSTTCGPTCRCQVCYNTTMHGEAIEAARATILERNPYAFDDKFRAPMGPGTSPSGEWMNQQMLHHNHNPHPPAMYRHHAGIPNNAGTPHPSPPPPRHQHPLPAPHHHPGPSASPNQQRGFYPNRGPSPKAVQYPPAPSPPTLPGPSSGLMNKYGCKCRRSFCLKKYCECFQHSAHCGSNCRCTNCKNFPGAGGPGNTDETAGMNSQPVSTTSGGEYPPREVTIVEESAEDMHRRVSMDHSFQYQDGASTSPTAADHTVSKGGNDRMAIMAAVAMTELLGGKKSPTSATSESSTPDLKNEDVKQLPTETSPDRRRVSPSVDREALQPSKKIKMSDTIDSDGVRTPCPSPPMVRMPHAQCIKPYAPQPRLYYGSHHGSPRSPPAGFHVVGSHQRGSYGMHNPSMSPSSAATSPGQYRHHHHAVMSPSSSLMYKAQHLPSSQHRSNGSTTLMRTSSTYEDVIRTSGLPKSLSFRKICSRCGKTRGEHGELGFGNKCVYQDCGKCGAGLHIHQKVNVPMGILCTLTVEDGASPGAAANYERKIQELASRAELQKELQKRKRDAAVRALAAGAP